MQPSRFAALMSLLLVTLCACSAPPTKSAPPLAIPTIESPAIDETEAITEDNYLHLWATTGVLSPLEMPDFAIDSPESTSACGNAVLTSYDKPDLEIYLTLLYAQPVLPVQINLIMKEATDGIRRVEVLNSRSGLGREIYSENLQRSEEFFQVNGCTHQITLPVTIDFAVDTIIVGFDTFAAAALLDAVELVGESSLNEEPVVNWRVSIADLPLSVAVNSSNLVVVATETNRLLKFDIEGNLVEELSAPSQGRIVDMTFDANENLLLGDGDFGEFFLLGPDGIIARDGGQSPLTQVAVSPAQENVYLLGDLGGMYYLLSHIPNSNEIINPLPLEGASYSGLAFNAANQLFSIRDSDGFLVEIDRKSGLEINSIPLRDEKEESIPRDLAIDQDGTFYILFAVNLEGSAVHHLDAQGFQVRVFGDTTQSAGSNWMEGSYFEPRAIAVSSDGKYAFIIDGDGESNYLTCLELK